MKLNILIVMLATSFQLLAKTEALKNTPIVTVGSDECMFGNIQGAVDYVSENNDSVTEIRVASNKNYVETLVLDDTNVSIIGGFSNCLAAQENNKNDEGFEISALTVDDAVISITGDQQVTVYLENMTLQNGEAGIVSTATVDLIMKSVILLNNSQYGAVFLYGNNTVTLDDSIITNNYGSGLVCAGENNLITIKGNSQLTHNTTASSGGGMLLGDGCYVDALSSTIISHNIANNGSGGGIYADSGAQVNLHGVSLESNQSGNKGGGIFVTGEGTTMALNQSSLSQNIVLDQASGSGGGIYIRLAAQVVMYDVTIQDNQGGRIGGGLSVVEGATVTLSQSNISQNNTTNGASGIYVGTGARANLHGVTIQDHQSSSVFAVVGADTFLLLTQSQISGNSGDFGKVGSVRSGATVDIENSMIYQNTGSFVLEAKEGGTLNLKYVTVTDNDTANATLVTSSEGSFRVESSIMYEMGDQPVYKDLDDTSSLEVICAIVHEDDSFSNDYSYLVSVTNHPDYLFVDWDAGDYHLKTASLAIDYCDEVVSLNLDYPKDIDGEARGYDAGSVNLYGPYDVGADEYYIDDVIFKDAFAAN